MAAAVVLIGMLLAGIPAVTTYRQSVSAGLRS
jgi:hypothetical protein